MRGSEHGRKAGADADGHDGCDTGRGRAPILGRPCQVIAVFGPTGVGKTAVAIALAERLRERGEDPVAVSADAMQVYEGLPILTGAASAHEQARLEHRLLGFVPIDETFSAGRLRPSERTRTIDELLARAGARSSSAARASI